MTSKVGELGYLLLKYLRKEEINTMATRTSATYFKENIFMIKPAFALLPQNFFNVSVMH